MDKEKHTSIKFCGLEKASRYVNNPYFRDIDELDDETFEARIYFAIKSFKVWDQEKPY